MSDEQVAARCQRVVELTARDVPVALIAHQTGLSVGRVLMIRRQDRQRRRLATRTRRPMEASEVAMIESMLADGANYAEIARTVGRTPSVIRRRWPGRAWTRQQIAEHQRARRALNVPGV